MIRRIISLAIAALFIQAAGCDWMPGKPTEADKPVIASTISSFQPLWTTNCSGCHGADGRWGPARPMNDPMYLAIADDEYLTRVIRDGVPGTLMPGFADANGGSMTSTQIDHVVAGMRKHWSNPAAAKDMNLPSMTGDIGNAARGSKTFATYCGGCHGDNGRGGSAGSVVNDSFLALASNQALRSAVICGRIDLGMPNFAGYAGGHKHSKRADLPALTNGQVSDIVAWLASHRVEFPGQPYPDTTKLDTTANAAGGASP